MIKDESITKMHTSDELVIKITDKTHIPSIRSKNSHTPKLFLMKISQKHQNLTIV